MTDIAPERDLDGGRLFRAWSGVSVTFFAFGIGIGLWFVHIAVVAESLALDPAPLGFALLNIGLGALIAPPIAAVIVGRLGSRRSCAIFALGTMVVMLGPILAPNFPLLYAATLLTGVVMGALNVAVNTQASEIEKRYGRPIMSTFHGFFSLGGLTAAGLGGALFSLGLSDGRGAVAIVAALVAALIWAARGYLPDTVAPNASAKGPGLTLPTAAVLGFAVLGFLSTTVEGSVGDWSALFLTTVKLTTYAEATLGYAMFAAAMTLCRFAGSAVVKRLGDRRVVLFGGLLVAAGMAVVVLAPQPLVSSFGFLVIGIGAANIAPVLISAGSRAPGVTPAMGVAAVTTALAAGLLLGPAIIGLLAQALGLATALSMVGAMGLVIFALALRPWPADPAP
jgi:predicted MFS family arabinose efflux permease